MTISRKAFVAVVCFSTAGAFTLNEHKVVDDCASFHADACSDTWTIRGKKKRYCAKKGSVFRCKELTNAKYKKKLEIGSFCNIGKDQCKTGTCDRTSCNMNKLDRKQLDCPSDIGICSTDEVSTKGKRCKFNPDTSSTQLGSQCQGWESYDTCKKGCLTHDGDWQEKRVCIKNPSSNVFTCHDKSHLHSLCYYLSSDIPSGSEKQLLLPGSNCVVKCEGALGPNAVDFLNMSKCVTLEGNASTCEGTGDEHNFLLKIGIQKTVKYGKCK